MADSTVAPMLQTPAEKRQEEILQNSTIGQMLKEYKDMKAELLEKEEADKYNTVNSFYTGKLNTKDYTETVSYTHLTLPPT